MGPFGCYQFDRLHCTCGECEACKHRALMEAEEKTEKHKSGVLTALKGFNRRVEEGKYVSPDEKREKAKQRMQES